MIARLAGLALLVLLVSVPATGGDTQVMSVSDAHAKAVRGELILIDVRTPAEWRETGVGEGANPVSMHRPGFVEKLEALTGGDRTRTVALICARGGRSKAMSEKLAGLGYTNVVDVTEGMLGSRAGPGWLKTGLPTVSCQ